MIARHLLLFLLLILIPDWYLYRRYLTRPNVKLWVRLMWWVITGAMIAYTGCLAVCQDFSPHPPLMLNIYLAILGVLILPKAFLAFGDALQSLTRRKGKRKRPIGWGVGLGVLLSFLSIYVTIYGFTLGFSKFQVTRIDYESADLPDAFDGYRIAVLSDAHVGSYDGPLNYLLDEAVDSLMAGKPDAVFFLGDVQNVWPEEIDNHAGQLGRLKAPDGVFSILGNHDYSFYIGGSEMRHAKSEQKTKEAEERLGWKLLLNEHAVIRHGGDSIVVAGMEGNEEKNTDHGYPHCDWAMKGVGADAFTIMLVHNPKWWRKQVLPGCHAQLTMSGHTHGGQVGLGSFNASSFTYRENDGMYEQDGRHLFVSRGLGAAIPLRFGITGEVVLMTLHKKKP